VSELSKLLSLPESEKVNRGLAHTPAEIAQQPDTWLSTFELSRSGQAEIVQFLASAGVSGAPACSLTVFLVGAGTSDDVGSIGPVHGDGNVSGLQMRRLSGGQSRKAKTRNKEAALPNELSISFHFAPTTISFSPMRLA
jgi:hypothetical protein